MKKKTCKVCNKTNTEVKFKSSMSSKCIECNTLDIKKEKKVLSQEDIIKWNLDNPIVLDNRTKYDGRI